jgi:hypothetical protein
VLHACHEFKNAEIWDILYIREHKFPTNLGTATKPRHQEGDPQMLGAIKLNLVARVTRRVGFMRLCYRSLREIDVLKRLACVLEAHGSKLAKDTDYSQFHSET